MKTIEIEKDGKVEVFYRNNTLTIYAALIAGFVFLVVSILWAIDREWTCVFFNSLISFLYFGEYRHCVKENYLFDVVAAISDVMDEEGGNKDA